VARGTARKPTTEHSDAPARADRGFAIPAQAHRYPRPVGNISLRLATAADAEQIRTIYNHEVMHTVATFDLVPRSLPDQRAWLAARSGAFAAVVAVDAAEHATGPATSPEADIVGFGALSPYKERAAYRTSVEDSVYVRRDRNGEGIGSLILAELLHVAATSGFHAVFARINVTGDSSIALHRKHGFELVGIEREVGRKFNRWHDVALMERLIT
jgi:L-amino acid N-acyltransferase